MSHVVVSVTPTAALSRYCLPKTLPFYFTQLLLCFVHSVFLFADVAFSCSVFDLSGPQYYCHSLGFLTCAM